MFHIFTFIVQLCSCCFTFCYTATLSDSKIKVYILSTMIIFYSYLTWRPGAVRVFYRQLQLLDEVSSVQTPLLPDIQQSLHLLFTAVISFPVQRRRKTSHYRSQAIVNAMFNYNHWFDQWISLLKIYIIQLHCRKPFLQTKIPNCVWGRQLWISVKDASCLLSQTQYLLFIQWL